MHKILQLVLRALMFVKVPSADQRTILQVAVRGICKAERRRGPARVKI
jgi:hypothetical protein